MANDDLDLTFIRCPSCRSLVPATATRCRMCGYLLQGDDAADSEASSDDSAFGHKGRVRQRTISLSEEERDEIKEKIAETEAQVDEQEIFDDVEELEEIADSSMSDEFDDSEALEDDDQEPDEPEYVDDGSDVGFEEADADFEAEMRSRREALEAELARRTNDAADDEEFDSTEVDDEVSELEAEPESEVAAEPKKRRRRRRKKKRPQSDEAVAPDSDEAEEAWSVEEPLVEVAPDVDDNSDAESIGQQEEEEAPVSAAQQDQGVQVSKGQQEGALVAWFVHYQENPDGAATEIREGRFFLGGSRLKESDIVIKHESISTPHCLIKAEPSQGVFVQDLMSVNGTLVKKNGQEDWEPVPVPMELGHGDWLRLGSYEVMVCVIPQQKE